MSASPAQTPLYKGKVTHRSWPQLPEELVRHIATLYLWDLSATNYCPQVWDTREHWHSRMVYAALRDSTDMEKFMSICPPWSLAVETHLFWQQAIALIDPLDSLGHHAILRPNPALTNNSSSLPLLPIRLTPYRHFRNITACSCLVCRINSPSTSAGLTFVKRTIPTPFLGPVGLCREHNHRRITFCGLCMREAPPFENETGMLVSCLENEDEETWPGVDATCRSCRSEWLWRRVCNNPRDCEAVGGAKMISADWETRQTIEGFIDLAEGTIADVINTAQEKHWLRKHTKLPDMLSQALAASRFTGREDALGYGRESDDELDLETSEVEEEEEEDTELMQMTEENGGVRDLAISDWARNRILDGHWFSPADQWYGNVLPNRPTAVTAVHPCPWTRDEEECDSDEEDVHPRPSTVRADVPPSYALCEQAYVAHQRQMRMILLPAMRNIVRRVVIECGADAVDPAMRGARMGLEDVVAELREEAVWFDGVDWLERRRNVRREENERRSREEGSDDSSQSSKSDGSHTTSPVLSTTTLQTTPSPPPSEGKKDDSDNHSVTRPVTIAVGPVLDPPRLLRPIPYVPVTVSHMPHYSLDAFKLVWREACAPLYHCRCKVCERAMAKVNAGNGKGTVPTQTQAEHPPAKATVTEIPVEIKLDEVIDVDGLGEEEVEQASEEAEEDEVEEEDSQLEEYGPRYSCSPPPKSRKRPCDELNDEDEDAEGDVDDDTLPRERARGGTPPKRARREEPGLQSVLYSPVRMKKRGSEELELEEDEDGSGAGNKRIKMGGELIEDAESPPTSITGTGESDSNSVAHAGDDEEGSESITIRHQSNGRLQVDLDDLYVLGED